VVSSNLFLSGNHWGKKRGTEGLAEGHFPKSKKELLWLSPYLEDFVGRMSNSPRRGILCT
jgi:hypothetical protein